MSVTVSNGDVFLTRFEFANPSSGVGYNLYHWIVRNLVVDATGLPPAVEVPVSEVAMALAEEISEIVADAWAPAASVMATFTGVTIQSVFPGVKSIPYTFSLPVPRSGEVIGDALPQQDSVTFVKRTPYGQRWGVGRLFFYGLAENDQANGRVVPEAVTRLNRFAESINGPITITAGVYRMTLVPALTHPTGKAPTFATAMVDFALSNNIVKVQRRRRPGVGI